MRLVPGRRTLRGRHPGPAAREALERGELPPPPSAVGLKKPDQQPNR
jgi:hypothetical protein